MIRAEFWPEFGSGPLWVDGTSVDPASVLPEELAARLIRWNDAYADEKLPMDGVGDADWLAEGQQLLQEVRERLVTTHEVMVTEPWWR